MKRHVKIYLDFFGYTIADTILCEVCGNVAVDIHHIDARGMGGNPLKDKDVIENLQALCRHCHEVYGDRKHLKDYLLSIHESKMKMKNLL